MLLYILVDKMLCPNNGIYRGIVLNTNISPEKHWVKWKTSLHYWVFG